MKYTSVDECPTKMTRDKKSGSIEGEENADDDPVAEDVNVID